MKEAIHLKGEKVASQVEKKSKRFYLAVGNFILEH